MITYANGIPVSETLTERHYKTGQIELREAFAAGGSAQARHCQEEIPDSLRAMVNLVRTLAVRTGAERRSPESILTQALEQLREHYPALEAWTA